MTEKKYREFADMFCGLRSVSDPKKEARSICRSLGVSREELDGEIGNEFGESLVGLLERLAKHV